jgi:hypothetical protein
MLIRQARIVRERDLARFAWASLQRFQNVDYVKKTICELHCLDKRWESQAAKQARQIRYCLTQAREYAIAAEAVSLATKPNLLYYSIMSLALAEILLKQDGSSSLDASREQNRHHGLSLRRERPRSQELEDAASKLRAVPLEIDGTRRGTFALWHRSSRHLPAVGKITIVHRASGEGTTRHDAIGGGDDQAPHDVPLAGLSLYDCLVSLPGMWDHLEGGACRILRGHLEMFIREHLREQDMSFALHPGPAHLIDEFASNVRVSPRFLEGVSIREYERGFHITTKGMFNWLPDISWPNSTAWTSEEQRLWPCDPPLNEFGFFYVALYIVGNYARYFPDRWILDVETSTPLALAVERMLTIAQWRVPLLALSEMSRTYFVPEA